MKRKLIVLGVVGGLVVLVDQGSKRLAVASLQHACEEIGREGPNPARVAVCHPERFAVSLGEGAARELKILRGPTPLWIAACDEGAACLRGLVRLHETPAGARGHVPERNAMGEALLMLRGVPIEANHLTTGPDGQLHHVVTTGADGQRSTLVVRYRSPRPGVDVIPGFLRLRYVENPGAAWGLFGDMDEGARGPFFFVVSALALAFLTIVYLRTRPQERRGRAALALILGGAVGNVLDRAVLGSVVDFIELHVQDRVRWPTFNVADVAISAGVLLLLVDGLAQLLRARRARTAGTAESADPRTASDTPRDDASSTASSARKEPQ